jgi:DUF1365 family protein
MTLRSCLYLGSVMHRRLRPRMHRFRYRAFWTLIDLDELPRLASRLRLLSHNRFNLFSLHDADHGDGSATPLRVQAERRLAQAGIELDGGTIRLFCMPRTLGYGFNPISLYFCHRRSGGLAAIIYQVHNTFGERHAYVAPVEPGVEVIRHRCRKAFHVSPFMDMDMSYQFRLTVPDQHFDLAIGANQDGRGVLSACLTASRQPLGDMALLRAFATVPLVTTKVILAIHWEALQLWLKGMRLRNHPEPPAAKITRAVSSLGQRIDTHAL